MSRRPTATVLKMIRGDRNTDRFKDDKPQVDGKPQVPPGTQLDETEQLMWDWLMTNVYLPGVHGVGDGASFVKIARLWSRCCAADAKVKEFGLVMKNPKSNKPELMTYVRLSRDLWQALGVALEQIGATPAGRVKLAGPKGAGYPGEPTSWDQID